MPKQHIRRLKLARMIKEAVDSYPGGLCLSTEAGKPILVNQRMNELVGILTGHTVIEVTSMWQEITAAEQQNGCVRLREQWLTGADQAGSTVIFRYPDGRIWRFRQTVLIAEGSTVIQTEGDDITDLYQKSEEHYRNNQRLLALQERQRDLLANIVKINRDKELLATKMRIHDELGRCLIATKQAMQKPLTPQERAGLLADWEEAIRDMENIPLTPTRSESSPEEELLRVAEMIGCKVIFRGSQPTERRVLLLLYAAVREALTNAVRHAGADRLLVDITETRKGFHVEISCSGSKEVTSVREGDGLSSLRRTLEQEGASMQVVCRGGVVLIVDLPAAEHRTKSTGGHNL